MFTVPFNKAQRQLQHLQIYLRCVTFESWSNTSTKLKHSFTELRYSHILFCSLRKKGTRETI